MNCTVVIERFRRVLRNLREDIAWETLLENISDDGWTRTPERYGFAIL